MLYASYYVTEGQTLIAFVPEFWEAIELARYHQAANAPRYGTDGELLRWRVRHIERGTLHVLPGLL